MARVFVSHASKDAALAAEARRWLVADGHEVFLDRHLSDGILTGDQWQQRLHERLRWADATVCVLTAAYLESVWCTAELAIAQARGSRLLPLRAEPEVCHPLLDGVQYTDMVKGAAGARAELAEALLRVDAAGGSGWPDDRSPFPGLRPLNTDEHSVFFGRSREVDQLAELLRSPAERAERAVLLVVGPSGCGKSSLVRAGLLPVMAVDEDWWTLPAILPGAQPVAALGRELAATAHQLGLSWSATGVRRRLDDGDLTGLVDDLLLAVPGRRRLHLLLVVDQFEELLTQTGPEERARLAELLRHALAGPLQVVATLRPEFLDQLLASPELAALPTRTQTVRPLRPEALRAVIEGPADRAGIGVDEDLVTRLVADTGGGEALPLLAYTLEKLAAGVTRGGQLSNNRYEELGGVRGALARQADAALAEAVAAGGRDRARVIQALLRLVTVDEQGRPTRWRIRRDELPHQVRTELQPFIDGHLLTTDTEHHHATGDEYVVIGVAHEAFLSAWPPLREAITASTAALQARREIEQAAEQWVGHGHAQTRLWGGDRLAAARADTGARLQMVRAADETEPAHTASGPVRRSVSRRPRRRRIVIADRVELSARARNFLTASIRRDRRRRRRGVTILSVLLVLALGAAAFAVDRQRAAVDQQRAAEAGQRLATARQLLAQAETHLDQDPRTALRLSEAAIRIHDGPETRSALVNNLLATRYAGTLTGHDGSATTVAFAPDRPLLASAGDDGTVRLWNMRDPAAPTPLSTLLTGHDGGVNAVAFAADGSLLASAGDDGTVRLWNMRDPAAPTPLSTLLTGHDGGVTAVAFALHRPLLATTGLDGTVRLWDTTDPAAPTPLGAPLTGHDGIAEAVAFAPDGRTLASAGFDGTVRLWNTTDPAAATPLGAPLTGHAVGVNTVVFSPDGRTLASAGGDGTVLLWHVIDPAAATPLGAPLTGHTEAVNAVAFSPNGQLLTSAGYDGTVRLWNTTDPAAATPLGAPLTSHEYAVLAVAFTPDGHTLASAGGDGTYGLDGTVRLWSTTDPAAPTPLGPPLAGHDGTLRAVAFAPDGRTLASAGFDDVVRLWNTTDPAAPTPLGAPLTATDPLNWVYTVAFTPDGNTLASAGDDGTVRLWNTTDPAAPTPLGLPLTGHDGAVNSVAFTPDGNTLASAGDDGTVRLWNTTDPAAPTPLGLPLTGHDGAVNTVAFTPDGNTLASAGSDGTVRLWSTTGLTELRDHVMRRACTITGGGLTVAEWDRYVKGLPYVGVCDT